MTPHVELRLFGHPWILVDGRAGPLPPKLAQAIAVLALSDTRTVSRTDLAALLWDGAPDPSANLRQLLRRLRRDLPALAAALGGDARVLRLVPDGIDLDLDAFARLRRSAGAAADALALLRGPLLEGVEECSESFEDWLRAARGRLDAQAEALVEAILRDPAGAGVEALLLAADHLAAAGPTPAQRHRLVDAFARLGRPDLARRFGAPGVAATAREPQPATPPPRRLRLAFHDLDASAAPGLGLPLRSFVEDCADHLASYRSFVVLAPHSTMRADPAPADVTVTGGLRLGGRGPALALRLVEAESGAIQWAGRFDVSPEALVDSATRLVRRIATQIAEALETRIAEHSRVAGRPDAYAALLRGREAMRICGLPQLRRARRAFLEAAAADPGLAAAPARVAETLYLEWILCAATDDATLLDAAALQAERARQADPGSAIAHWMSGAVALYRGQTDRVLDHFADAEALSPHNADLMLEHADALGHLERHDAAERRFEEALTLNPTPPDSYWWAGAGIAFARGDFATAAARCERIASEEAALMLRTASYAMAGQPGQARRWARRARAVFPDVTADALVRLSPDRPDGERMRNYRSGLAMAGFN